MNTVLKKIICFAAIQLCCNLFIFSQNIKPDSLIRLSGKQRQDTVQCRLYCKIGVLYQGNGKYNEAITYFNQSLNIYKKLLIVKHENITYKKGISECLHNIGMVYDSQSNYTKAIEYYLAALRAAEEINSKIQIQEYLKSIAFTYNKIGNLKVSIEYFTKSLKIAEELGDSPEIATATSGKSRIAWCYNSLGVVHRDRNNYDMAIKFFGKALLLFQELNDTKGIAYCTGNLGMINKYRGNYYKAKEYYEKSLKISEELGDRNAISISLNEIGSIYNLIGESYKSIEYSARSLKIAKENKYLQLLQAVYFNLYETYNKIHKPDSALKYFKLSAQIKDSISNSEMQKQITEMQTIYETEKRGREIVYLQKENIAKELDNTKQKNIRNVFIFCALLLLIASAALFVLFYLKYKANRKLSESESSLRELNATKDKFFSIISHDLRGPLASIRTTLGMYAENTDSFSKEEMQAFTKSILQSTDNIGNLFENLLTWSRTETNRIVCKPEEFDLSEIAVLTVKFLETKASQKQIKLSCQMAKNTWIYADKNMVSFVLRNLVDNAVKFTNVGGNIIINTTVHDENFIEVSVADNGIGIPEENRDKLFHLNSSFSTMGTGNEKGTGLGLVLCREFISRNKGEIWVNSQPGNGTTFFFTLEKAEPD
ncbi:MAG: tetratricopeptide repeat-containing sensor histidine kinase [Bacteroidia bacterium]|nr:tetratricopeptide repeat-containing sensor histidine kinase [Bacteroidia bacterium]